MASVTSIQNSKRYTGYFPQISSSTAGLAQRGEYSNKIPTQELLCALENTTLHGLKQGTKLLVVESICRGAGVSSTLVLVYNAFRSVKYQDLHELKVFLDNSTSDEVLPISV